MLLHEQVINTSDGCCTSAKKREKLPIHCAKKKSFQCVSQLARIGELHRRSKEKNQVRKIAGERHMQKKLKALKHIAKGCLKYYVNVKKR